WVHQEYRELEILSEITRLRHEGQLPDHINGHHRNTLIRQYQLWKGLNIAPKSIHPAITWSSQSPMKLLSHVEDDEWVIIKTDSKNKPVTQAKACEALINRMCVPALGSTAVAISPTIKRKADDVELDGPCKRMKTNVSDDNTFPTGFKQDNMNFSCAYDVIFTILYGLWKARQPVWVKSFNKLN
ncbi:hypothetical protein FIBSPDRAFT_673373, partial [Athelia psychrophila]